MSADHSRSPTGVAASEETCALVEQRGPREEAEQEQAPGLLENGHENHEIAPADTRVLGFFGPGGETARFDD